MSWPVRVSLILTSNSKAEAMLFPSGLNTVDLNDPGTDNLSFAGFGVPDNKLSAA